MSLTLGSLWPKSLLPVSYTALNMLLCSSVKYKTLFTCPLAVVQSVGKNHIFAYRVSLQKLLCLNLTNASKCVAEMTTASKLHSTDYVSVFICQLQGILHMSSCDGAGGRENLIFAYRISLRNLETYFA